MLFTDGKFASLELHVELFSIQTGHTLKILFTALGAHFVIDNNRLLIIDSRYHKIVCQSVGRFLFACITLSTLTSAMPLQLVLPKNNAPLGTIVSTKILNMD